MGRTEVVTRPSGGLPDADAKYVRDIGTMRLAYLACPLSVERHADAWKR